MDPGAILGIVYVVIGALFGIYYSVRRHGIVPSNLDSGLIGASLIGVIWPLAIFLPALRSPQPCTCREHVLARQQERLEDERFQEALRQERGEG